MHQVAILISETHLRASNRLSFRNFRVNRTNREGAPGGGTAILIESTIGYQADLALDLNNIEAITANLATGVQLTNASGTCLRRFADDFHLLEDAAAEPTIFPHNGQPDVLDIVVVKDVAQFHQLTILNELSSYHNPVLLQLGQATREEEEPQSQHDHGVVARFHGSSLHQHWSYNGSK
ncbi:hypothetical protein Trydic_g22587 [Trypoxylus dichotomus]